MFILFILFVLILRRPSRCTDDVSGEDVRKSITKFEFCMTTSEYTYRNLLNMVALKLKECLSLKKAKKINKI